MRRERAAIGAQSCVRPGDDGADQGSGGGGAAATRRECLCRRQHLLTDLAEFRSIQLFGLLGTLSRGQPLLNARCSSMMIPEPARAYTGRQRSSCAAWASTADRAETHICKKSPSYSMGANGRPLTARLKRLREHSSRWNVRVARLLKRYAPAGGSHVYAGKPNPGQQRWCRTIGGNFGAYRNVRYGLGGRPTRSLADGGQRCRPHDHQLRASTLRPDHLVGERYRSERVASA